jgi:hypothetical protein
MVVVMRTGHKHKHPLEEGLEHINPIKAQLLKIFGPADGLGNPLVGTQYDPVVRQKIETERRHERWARQEERRHAHAERRYAHSEGSAAQPETQEHSTPDTD